MKKAYVVGYESNGSGGFDWYFTPAAQKVAHREELKNVKAFANENYRTMMFTYEYDENLSHDEVTAEIDVYFNSDEFDEEHPEWHVQYLKHGIEDLERVNFELRMKVKEYRKLLEYNNIPWGVENDA
jgi:hypothetical protein